MTGAKHCTVRWNGRGDADSRVVLTDNSSNGTWVRAAAVVPLLAES